MEKRKILIIRFNNTLNHGEIPLFRGAIISTMNNANILFHNHNEEKLRYAYPLIQYKRINGCAAIVCIDQGTEAIGDFFSSCDFDIQIGDRPAKLEIGSINSTQVIIQAFDGLFEYHLRKWLPLNQKNFQIFQKMDSISEKYTMLEKVLTGNILSFAKGINLHIDQQIITKITNANSPHQLTYKGVKMIAMDIEFKSNISLPNFIGLGKGVSIGFGIVTRKNDNNINQKLYG